MTTASDYLGRSAAEVMEAVCPLGEPIAGVAVEQDWDNETTRVTFEDGSVLIVTCDGVQLDASSTRVKWVVDIETTGCDDMQQLRRWAASAQEYLDANDIPVDVVTREEVGCGSGLQLDGDDSRYHELSRATERAFEHAWERMAE